MEQEWREAICEDIERTTIDLLDIEKSIRLALIELRGTVVSEKLARVRIDAAIRLLEKCL